MTARKTFPVTAAIPERSTYQYRVAVTDAAGLPVAPAQVTSILATLRDAATGTILNSRSSQEVKDVNGGSLTSGLFVLQFAEADNAIIGNEQDEPHVLTLDFRLTGGGRVTREIWFYVANFGSIAA
jgi:hypothetical protein